MRTRFIRNADKTPVACVVSTGPGRVGWSVYHPKDLVEVPRFRHSFVGGQVVRVPVTDGLGRQVMTKQKAPFSREEAKRVAAEREFSDVEKCITSMDLGVPEGRSFTKESLVRCHLVDDNGIRVDSNNFFKGVVEDWDLKDELARQIYAMHKRSLRQPPQGA